MNEKTAKDIMEALAWMSFPIDKLANHIFNLPKGEERDWFIEHFKKLFLSADEVMTEIVRQYRHLDPIGPGEDWFFSLKQKYQTAEYPAKKLSEEEKASAENAGIEAAAEIEKELKSRDLE